MAPRKEDFEDDEDLDSEDDSDDDLTSEEEGENGGGSSKAFIGKLELDLDADPYNAELHAALISALREAANLDRLTFVRRRAASKVLLPEPLWFEWLQDEQNLADDAGFKELDALHEEACVARPLSSRIWLARCALLQGRPAPNKVPTETIRAAYEAALDILGLHPTEGVEIWAEYREFEETLLQGLTEKVAHKQQVLRVRALFLRQLALPLPGLERLKETFATFESNLDAAVRDPMAAAKAEAIMEEGAEGWQEREALEKRLLDSSRPSMNFSDTTSVEEKCAQVSAELLPIEEASGDPKRIFLAHLRATHWSPADEQRWHCLVRFVCGTLKEPSKLVNVLESAVRGCPKCKDLWLQLHLERESSGASLDDLRKLVERGVEAIEKTGAKDSSSAAVQELLLQHADACRRAAAAPQSQADCWVQMRATFERVVSLSEAHSAENGLACQALMNWMRLEAYGARNAKGTMDVGNRLMKIWGSYYNGWSAFIAAVRYSIGSEAYSTVRELYQRAMAQVADYPSQIRSDSVQFERECGTLQSWREMRDADVECQQSETASAPQTAEAVGQEQPQVDAEEDEANDDTKKRTKPNVSGQEKKKRRREKLAAEAAGLADGAEAGEMSQSAAPQKEKAEVAPSPVATPAVKVQATKEASGKDLKTTAMPPESKPKPAPVADVKPDPAPAAKKPAATQPKKEDTPAVASTAGAEPKDVSTGDDEADSGSKGGARVEAKVQAHLGSHFHQKRLAAGDDGVPLQTDEEGKQTVYVSNLDWSVDEEQLQQLFSDVAGLKEVRLIRDFLQRSKGYAYIDFEKSEQVNKAVNKRNGYMLNKRALFVARSKPTKALFEDKTVFVKNVGAKASEADIREMFSAKGEILGVRLPTDDAASGSHKGYAYVEFSTAESTTESLTLDGKELCGQRIHVTRSIPMKDHRHQTAGARKDIAQRANQKQIVDGLTARSDPVAGAQNHPTTIYVKNMNFKVDDQKIKEHFKECGEVMKVMICRNANGRSKGFGFVEFANADQAQAALAYNDSVLCGREIWVSKSQRAITLKGVEGGGIAVEKKVGDAAKPAKAKPEEKKVLPREATAGTLGGKRRLDLGDKKLEVDAESVVDEPAEPAKKQFRAVKEKPQEQTVKEPVASGKAEAEAKPVTVGKAEEPKPMSNADFRKLMLG